MKIKDIKKMDKEERIKKIEEMKLELIKAKAGASKSGHLKVKEVKKVIARILTLNNQGDKTSNKVGNHK